MFDAKKDADAHDKMLELAESFSSLFEKQIEGISEQVAEDIGLLFAKNKEVLMAACKGKPELLLEFGNQTQHEESNITPLTAKA
jgi:dsDNA-binding SOS-regulon protein